MQIIKTGDVELPSSEVDPGSAARAQRVRGITAEVGGQAALSRKSGVPMATLSRVLAGQDMKAGVMIALAQAADVRLEWLALGRGPMRASEASMAPGAPSGTVLIPRYDARASAGSANLIEAGPAIEQVPFPLDFIRHTLRRSPTYLALLECGGDSMVPTIYDGDLLMVDTSVTEVGPSQLIYILSVGNALLAKRLQRRVDGSILIISDNQRYPQEVFTPAEGPHLHIYGEVIWRSGTIHP